MSKFIIFAIARSGSTSLARLLGKSEDVAMAVEPFHESYSERHPDEPDYASLVTNPSSLDSALETIFKKYTAIKVLNYQLDTDLYKHLFLKDLKVLYLYRNNILDSLISAEVAKQTSIWHRDEINDDKLDKTYSNLQPLDIEHIKKSHTYIKKQRSELLSFLNHNKPGDYIELVYENLYSENLQENIATIQKICNFLGISMPSKKYIKQYMTPTKAKINQDRLYRAVPNYQEIKQLFDL